MELDATFKSGGRPGKPRNPNKERQFKERLCFNCNQPGHLARDCKKPKKTQGRKYPPQGRQLNATWKGRGGYNELAVTSNNELDWDVDNEDLEEYESSEEEAEGELTTAGQMELDEFTEIAKRTCFKEQLPYLVADMRQRILRKGTLLAIPVPRAPQQWLGTKQDWECAVRAMRCRPGYPQGEEPRGADHSEAEAAGWLQARLVYYDAQDEALQYTPEPWELRADQAGLDYEPTNKDVEDLRDIMKEHRIKGQPAPKHEPTQEELRTLVDEINDTHDKAMNLDMELEDHNVAEIDHPWHAYLPWSGCYTNECATHYDQKVKHKNFPRSQIPVYYSWPEMEEIVRRRRSTGQLQSKN
jgi:hypothetical protein